MRFATGRFSTLAKHLVALSSYFEVGYAAKLRLLQSNVLGRSACDALFSNSLCLEGFVFVLRDSMSMMLSAADNKMSNARLP